MQCYQVKIEKTPRDIKFALPKRELTNFKTQKEAEEFFNTQEDQFKTSKNGTTRVFITLRLVDAKGAITKELKRLRSTLIE